MKTYVFNTLSYNSKVRFTTFSRVNSFSNMAREFLPILCLSFLSLISNANFSDNISTFPTGTLKPLYSSITVSSHPGALVVIMGLPIAMASMVDFGSPSL